MSTYSIKTKTITFISILTDTLVANPVLGMKRIPKLKSRLIDEPGMANAIHTLTQLVQECLEPYPALEEHFKAPWNHPEDELVFESRYCFIKRLIESMESHPEHAVKVIGGIMRWSARHSGFSDIEA